jgi:hypothetical protein
MLLTFFYSVRFKSDYIKTIISTRTAVVTVVIRYCSVVAGGKYRVDTKVKVQYSISIKIQAQHFRVRYIAYLNPP